MVHLLKQCFLKKHIYNLKFMRAASGKTEHVMNVFDRKAKREQRNRTALLEDYEVYEYLKEEV